MKQIPKWLLRQMAVIMIIAAQGCALFLIGAGAGVAVGVVSYSGNELRVTLDAGLNQAWEASKSAMKDMEYTVIPAETHKDGSGGILQGRNATDQPVRIQLLRQTDKVTEIRIRIGEFDTAANKAAAQVLYDKLKIHL